MEMDKLQIGDAFIFDSYGRKRIALFLEYRCDFIKAVITNDNRFNGTKILIHKNQFIEKACHPHVWIATKFDKEGDPEEYECANCCEISKSFIKN